MKNSTRVTFAAVGGLLVALALSPSAQSSCVSATILSTNAGGGSLRSSIWTSGVFSPGYYPGYLPYAYTPPVTPAFDGVFWALGRGVEANNGTWDVTNWFSYGAYPAYGIFYAGEISTGWGASPTINGCITDGGPNQCTCILLTDQDGTNGFSALTCAAANDQGNTFFNQPGVDPAGNGAPIILQPIPAPQINNIARTGTGTVEVDVASIVQSEIDSGLYLSAACTTGAVVGYKVYEQVVPRGAPAPADRSVASGWTNPTAVTPIGQPVTMTANCLESQDLFLATTLVFDSSFETSHVSMNSIRIECPPLIDSDGDGLSDDDENVLGTDPSNPDTDGDGLLDGFEVEHGFDPLTPVEGPEDPDGDGLNNLDEQSEGTDPRNSDTDDDGLPDGEEVNLSTDPLDPDSDDDELTDGEEVNTFGTDPLNPDTDGGGRSDGLEVNVDGTDPLNPSDDLRRRLAMAVDDSTKSAIVFDTLRDEILGTVDFQLLGEAAGDCAITGNGALGFATDFGSRIWAIDLESTPPVLAPDPNPIPIDNPGEDVVLTPDNRFVLACDGSARRPISVVDVATRTQIHTFDLGTDCNSVDVCSDGSVLVSSNNSNAVRRLTIDESGVLTDTGESVNVRDPNNVYCAPDSQSGVALSRLDSAVESFTIPGLTAVDQKNLSGSSALSASLNEEGNKVYVRSNNAVDVFSYDSASAALGGPLLTIPLPSGADTFFGMEQMALDLTETKLYVSQPNAINIYDAETGALISSIVDPAIVLPTGICVSPLLDSDGDGLSDEEEGNLGTDPNNPDTDGDGLLDGFEVTHGFDPLLPGEELQDPDGDGLNNLDEQSQGTDPLDPDSDDDGLLDGQEVNLQGTDPLNPDSDDDGLSDGQEVNLFGTNPLNPDTDGGGRSDGLEVNVHGTDPLNPLDDLRPMLGMVVDNATRSVVVFDTITDEILGSVPFDFGGSAAGDCAISADEMLGFATDFGSRIWGIDLASMPPALAPPPNPIPIANPGEDVVLTVDGKFLLTCDGSVTAPVSVIDVVTRTEIHTFDLGTDCNSVDVCDDGSVLVSSSNTNLVRRLTIDDSGVLTDTGEALSVPAPQNVYCAPGSRSGVVVLFFDSIVQSFTVPGLSLVDGFSLSGFDGISGWVNREGDRVFVRSNSVVDVFSYDPISAALGGPLLTIPLPSPTAGFFGMEQIALDPSETKLYVSQPNAVNVYDVATGTLISSIADPAIVSPTGICVEPFLDSDGDGLSDDDENRLGTDPNNPDTDGDGLLDGFEVRHGFDPLLPGEELLDPDEDGLNNLEEQAAETDPNNPDTDGDGLTDSEEILLVGTDPRDPDTDGDTVLDGSDNCPLTANPAQSDAIHPNGIGDACDDPDADGVFDLADNCPDTSNPDQSDDVHPNGIGDKCDDPDGDGVFDSDDNCADTANPSQNDQDGDEVGDLCDICPAIANPDQLEVTACVEVIEDGGQCLETAISLLGDDIDGEIRVFGTGVLKSVTFEVLATSCAAVDPIEFFLNNSPLGTLNPDPVLACSCIPGIQTLTVSDGAFLQTIWNARDVNSFRFDKEGSDTTVAWVRVRLDFASLSETVCMLDVGGGDCSENNLCAAGSSFDPVSHETSITDPFASMPVSTTPFAASQLPGLIDIESLASGPAEICVSASDSAPGLLYGSSRNGDLFTLDLEAGNGTFVGLLPVFATEIEFDNLTGRAFAQAPDGAFFGHEFNIADGSGIGGAIPNGGSFTGLEYVGATLYGTVIFSSGGPSQLRTLSPFIGESTLIGSTGIGPISGLAFDTRSSVMYGIQGGPGPANLVTVDLTTGLATIVGSTGIQAGSLQFGPDGKLYGGGTGSNGGELYRIDPATGAATFVGVTGFPSVTGLTLVGGSAEDCIDFTHQGEGDMAINGAPCGPPTANAGDDLLEECSSPVGGTVTLNGSASTDPNSTPGTNDDIVLFEWIEDLGAPSETLLGIGEMLEITLPVGLHHISLRVTDSFGETSIDEALIRVVDTVPPMLTVQLSESVLWPPNHRMVAVSASLIASDACGDPSLLLISATSNEPDNSSGTGDGNTVDDIQSADLGTMDFEVELRAERAGSGNGRIYSVAYQAMDGSGNATDGSAQVEVPLGQGGVTEPLQLYVREDSAGTVVEWNPVTGALFYNVIRGDVSRIRDLEPAYDLGAVVCIEGGSQNENTIGNQDPDLPPPGGVFFYVVEYDDGLRSSYGTSSAAKPRLPRSGDCQ